MEPLNFELLFAIAAAALILSMTVAASMSHRREHRIPARSRRPH